MKFEVKSINGSTSFVTFNKGYSHIIVDGGCWVIVNGKNNSAYIFEEAMEALKKLPNKPTDYKPYRKAVGMTD